MQSTRACLGLFLALTILATGCGPEDTGPPTFPVSGTVTWKGKPVEGVAVTFVPDGIGESAVGITDASGRYSLTTRVKDDGALAGKYKVTLAKYDGGDQKVASPNEMHADYDITNEYPEGYDESKAPATMSTNVLPTQYADPTKSGLTAEVVEGGENSFNFDVK